MIKFGENWYDIRFVDHTPEKIKALKFTPRANSLGKRLLGDRPGTICILQIHDRPDPKSTVLQEWFGISKVFSGEKAKVKYIPVPNPIDDTSVLRMEVFPPKSPDHYIRKAGHAESLNHALQKLGFDKYERSEFFDCWKAANEKPTS